MRRVVIDTETTGFEYAGHDRIVEIAVVELDGTKLTGAFWQSYVNPKVKISPGAFKVHGITDQFLEDKPSFQEVVEDLLDFLGDSEIIGHNLLGFDRHFLDKEMKIAGQLSLVNPMVDTLLMARAVRGNKRNNLDALCKDFKIENTREGIHGALVDADLTAKVFCHLIQTVGTVKMDLVEATPEPVDISSLQQVIVQATPEEIDLHDKMCKELGIKAWQHQPQAKSRQPKAT